MADSNKTEDQLFVAVHRDTAFIRVRERGSFKVSKPLKNFGAAAIDQGVRRIVVDLAECIGMDSTFMGVLAGIAFRLRAMKNGELYIVNLSARTRGLLATLGLDQVAKPCMSGSTPEEFKPILEAANRMTAMEAGEETRKDTAEMMLEAHENLVELSPDNRPRFKDVLTFLRQDVHKAREDDPEKT